MTIIKSYTDISQSKKLAKILPIESADMRYAPFGDTHPWVWEEEVKLLEKDSVPCWSLAALLGVLPNGIVMNKDSQNGRYHFSSKYIGTYVTADNPVDACVAMIEKLHELNLL